MLALSCAVSVRRLLDTTLVAIGNGALGALILSCRISVAAAQGAPTAASPSAPPLRHEILRGTVTVATPAGPRPIDSADVVATRAPDRAFKATKTDRAGQFTIDWPDGTGDYLVHVSAVGYQASRKRVIRTGSDSIVTVDVVLQPLNAALQLGPVVTTARKPKPDRNPPFGADVGASEQLSGGMNGKLPPDLAGDLAAIASTMPGVLPTSGGISVLGLSPDQNSTTLNGMSFAGADVPRDANTRVRVSSSAYDPARGWFSGANTNVELAPGNVFGGRRSHLTLDTPALQYTDPISARLGQRFNGGQFSLGGDGELIEDNWYYNIGMQGGRRAAPIASLGVADNDLLRHAGLAPDSAARLSSLLNVAGIPASAPGVSANAIQDNVSFIGRFDHRPYEPTTLASARSTWGITTYGKLSRSGALATNPLSTAAHGGEASQQIASAQALYSTYFGDDYLADLRSGFSFSHSRTTPYLALPDARVRVESDFADLVGGTTTLQFGGNGALNADTKRWTWENTADVQLYASGAPRHRIKLSGDVRLDGYAQDAIPNALGTFSYNSLADLASNQPASFIRTIGSPARDGAEWNAFGAIGDLWRINPAWQLMYGARIEGNAFTDAPAYNATVDQLFGVRTDRAPSALHVSPRFGFNYNRAGQVRNSNIANPLGRFTGTTPGVLRGGFGEFKSFTPAELLSSAFVSTALPGSLQQLTCIGAGVPTPDWRSYAARASSIPSSCAMTGGAFADNAPNVLSFDRAWSAARSWRGNLAWQSVAGAFNYTLEGLYSLNLNQPGSYDLNFSGIPRFSVRDENRPVYAPASSIVPATGLVGTSDAHLSSEFGHVVSMRGDGRSVSRQGTLTLSPNLIGGGFSNFYIAGSYTVSSIRALQRGFDGTTFASPAQRYWTRGDLDARHQFMLQGGYTRGPLTLSLFGRLQSGLPFTPIVGGDVNGDGLANDRAFVFDPARASDTAVSRGLRDLTAESARGVRDCLTRQFGSAAGAASCEGPWTASLNTRIGIVGDGRHLSRRVDIGLNLTNPLGGIDQLVHGSNGLRGWGTAATPDPVLFNVRGWDASAQRFLYSVNPRFGDTRPSTTTIRAPFRLTLDVSVDIGRPIEEQQVDRWLKPGRNGRRGVKADVQDLKRRYDRNVPDLYAQLLQQTDSLLLSREQVDALQQARTTFRVRTDSVWTELATYLAALPDSYDSRAAYRHAEGAIDGTWELTRLELRRTLPTILNPVQLRLLPAIVRLVYDANSPLHIRIFIAGG